MGPIDYAINEVSFTIPERILHAVFIGGLSRSATVTATVANQIRKRVVDARIMTSLDLIGGQTITIPLNGSEFETIDEYTTVVRIPPEKLGGRSIIQALNISFNDPAAMSYSDVASVYHSNTMLRAAEAVMDTHAAMPMTSVHRLDVINENTILIHESWAIPSDAWLLCTVSNDSELKHISRFSYDKFAELVVLAVQSYIYLTMRTELDAGRVEFGRDIPSFKETVEEYKDSELSYKELLKKFRKIMMFNDNYQIRRHNRLYMGGHR